MQRKRGIVWSAARARTGKLALELSTLEHGMIGYPEALAAYQDDAAVRLGRALGKSPEEMRAIWKANSERPLRAPAAMSEDEYPF